MSGRIYKIETAKRIFVRNYTKQLIDFVRESAISYSLPGKNNFIELNEYILDLLARCIHLKEKHNDLCYAILNTLDSNKIHLCLRVKTPFNTDELENLRAELMKTTDLFMEVIQEIETNKIQTICETIPS